MNRLALALAAALALSGCDAAPAAPTGKPTAVRATAETGARPDFAAAYPGGEVMGAPVTAGGGEGGLLTFTTTDAPEKVIDFYKARAEAAGMTPVMAMNQGDARAYGAAGGRKASATLQVVASPDAEAGRTSVQLSWSAGA